MEPDRDTERGARIRKLREQRGRTQRAIADAVGVSERAVQRWEHGGDIAWPNLVRLAHVLATTAEELLDGPAPEGHDPVVARIERLEARTVMLRDLVTGEQLAQIRQDAVDRIQTFHEETRATLDRSIQSMHTAVAQNDLAVREMFAQLSRAFDADREERISALRETREQVAELAIAVRELQREIATLRTLVEPAERPQRRAAQNSR